jgi:hypothetical protein
VKELFFSAVMDAGLKELAALKNLATLIPSGTEGTTAGPHGRRGDA